MKEMFGLRAERQFASRSDFNAAQTFHPEDRQRVKEAFDAALSSGASRYEIEYRILPRPGEVQWVRSYGKIFRDADGRPSRVSGALTDITERKLAADALRESEARFRRLTELSSDWYWTQDENLRYSYFSEYANDQAGYPAESPMGKTRWELPVIPLSCSWPEHQALLAARQPFRDFEYSRSGEDGRIRYISVSGVPVFDEQGRFRGYEGVARNITERKRIEEELRRRQEMLELAQKAARAIAFEWRMGEGEGENRWSPDLEAMYGFAPGTYDGTYETWKRRVHPADWPAVEEAIKHAQRTGEVTSEYRVVHPDDSVHWMQAKGRMFFGADGKPARMVGFMQDVTERRQAQEELLRLERRLRQAQRLEAMGTLAGGIAHDFNNILGAVLGYGEMALRDSAKGSRQRRDLDAIMAAGERGRALVDRVLAFSRSGVGERIAVHVEAVVREVLDLLSGKLPAGVEIHTRLQAGRAAVTGDPTQVHQVLMNLATNAIQAMPAGGRLLVCLDHVHFAQPRYATTGPVAAGEWLALSVVDSGTGIPADILERIFDPFFTTKEVGVGSGLGLSLVHGIVTELGGAVDVDSTPGAGSTFTVYLPRSGDALDRPSEALPAMPRGERQRILVVDDEEPLVRIATETLAELGYEANGYTSSAAALAAFRADPQRFDAVITDERMPGMTGSALIREVRGIRDRIPIVLMSGFIGGGVLTRAREAGADDVLKKPLSARELATSLARVLQS
jgi:PAS domain S-box-containing protein